MPRATSPTRLGEGSRGHGGLCRQGPGWAGSPLSPASSPRHSRVNWSSARASQINEESLHPGSRRWLRPATGSPRAQHAHMSMAGSLNHDSTPEHVTQRATPWEPRKHLEPPVIHGGKGPGINARPPLPFPSQPLASFPGTEASALSSEVTES